MSALPAITQHVEGTTRFLCPHCRSDDVRKVSLMYEQATSNLNYRALSMNDQGGAAYTAGSGGLQNLMGGRIAPPVEPAAPIAPRFPLLSSLWSAGWFLFISHAAIKQGAAFWQIHRATTGEWVGALFGFLVCFPILIFLPIYLVGMSDYRRKLENFKNHVYPSYAARMSAWSRSWMCMRCGEIHERRA